MATVNVVYWHATGELMAQVDWYGPEVGSHRRRFLHSSCEPGELSQCSLNRMTLTAPQRLLSSSLYRPEPPFRTGLCFTRDVSFIYSPRFLRDPSTDRPETLPHDQNLAVFYKLTSKIRGVLPQKNLGAKNMQNFGQFLTTSDFDREYLRNEATYPKSESRTN